MAVFPSVSSLAPETITIRTRNIKSTMESGETRVKNKWPYPLRDVSLKFTTPDKGTAALIWQFYLSRNGGYEAFNYFLVQANTYEGEYVGTGDGSTVAFNLPSKQGGSYAIYVDGVIQEETTDYTFSSEGGADGADLLTFVSAPSAGQRITYDFVGYLKIRGRFEDDSLEYVTFLDRIVNIGLKIKGELNA